MNKGKIEATVRGSVNPYFGVYTEPPYHTVVEIKAIAKKDWTKIIQSMAKNASFVSKLPKTVFRSVSDRPSLNSYA